MAEPARLWNRNYTLLWQGQLVSQLGSQAFFIAMAFWIKHETGSTTIMGLVMMASQIPAVLLSPLAGVYADRHSRKAIIVGCDLINGTLTIALALIFLVWPERIDGNLAALFVVAVLTASVTTFFRPAVGAAIPDIVPRERLNAANSFSQGSLQIAGLLGQSAGGVLFRVLGAPVLFLIDGISYLLSAASEMFMKIPFEAPAEPVSTVGVWRRTWRDISEGLRYVWEQAGMRNLLLMAAALNFLTAPYLVLLPFFVEDTLGGTPDWYGYIVAAFSAGGLLGYALAGTLRVSGTVRGLLIVISLLVMTALFAAMGIAPDLPSALGIMFATGITNGFFNINLISLFQMHTPTQMRGRVFSLLGMLAQGLMPIAMGLTGVVADLMDQNIRLIYVATGTISLVIALAMSFNRPFRRYLADEPA